MTRVEVVVWTTVPLCHNCALTRPPSLCVVLPASPRLHIILLCFLPPGNRWEDYLQKNLTVADSNGGEYVLETDPASFLNILDILSSQLTFR